MKTHQSEVTAVSVYYRSRIHDLTTYVAQNVGCRAITRLTGCGSGIRMIFLHFLLPRILGVQNSETQLPSSQDFGYLKFGNPNIFELGFWVSKIRKPNIKQISSSCTVAESNSAEKQINSHRKVKNKILCGKTAIFHTKRRKTKKIKHFVHRFKIFRANCEEFYQIPHKLFGHCQNVRTLNKQNSQSAFFGSRIRLKIRIKSIILIVHKMQIFLK